MNKLFYISSFLFASVLFLPDPCEDGYIIEIPETIDLSETRSFDIRIIRNDLDDNQILHVSLPETFVLKDSFGKEDIEGTVSGNAIEFVKNGPNSVTVELDFAKLPAGDWHGLLPLTISLETKVPSNVLEKGSDLNALLRTIDPRELIFTSQIPQASFFGDVSLAKDESIILYESDGIAYIANNSDQRILSGEDLSQAFKGLTSLSHIDLSHLDTSECKDMSHMFEDDSSLTMIDGIETLETKNVRSMNSLFAGCEELSALSIGNWDVSEVLDTSDMFLYCNKLKRLSLGSWNVAKCENFSSMFAQCTALSSVGDLSAWDLSGARNIAGLFDTCRSLRSIGNLSSWNTANVIDLSRVFRNCGKLTNIGDLSGWDVRNAEDLSELFANATSLSFVGDLSIWKVSSRCHSLAGIFRNAGSLLPATFDLSGWDVSGVRDMSYMFENAYVLQNLNISGWNTQALKNAEGMFAFSETGRLSQLSEIVGIQDIDTAALENISKIFYENQYLNADLSAWNTSSLQNISYAFYGTYRFDVNKLKHWNVSSVSDMTQAFGDNAGSYLSSAIPDWYH